MLLSTFLSMSVAPPNTTERQPVVRVLLLACPVLLAREVGILLLADFCVLSSPAQRGRKHERNNQPRLIYVLLLRLFSVEIRRYLMTDLSIPHLYGRQKLIMSGSYTTSCDDVLADVMKLFILIDNK